MMATSAANTGVKGKLVAWAFIIFLANKPLPRIRFSENSSGTICLILVMLTRLTIPVMDLRKASQESRWYWGLDLSKDAATCIARKRAGGIYIPPDHVFKSLANLARWAVSLSCSLVFFFFVWIGFRDLDSCDLRFEVLVLPGILNRPRLNISSGVRRRTRPAASGRWSMESSVGHSRRRMRIWSATTSCARDWLTRWARKVAVERQMI